MVFWLAFNGLLLVAGYLLGSVPTGFVLAKLLKGIDLRQEGSGSTGATNVLRTLGKGPAVVVLLVDVLKGVGAIALTRWVYPLYGATPPVNFLPPIPDIVTPTQWLPYMTTLVGLAALLGHSKSIWIGFKGGKSIATGLGVLLALSWQVGLATLGVFLLTLALFRIVSLGSVVAAAAVSVLMLVAQQPFPYLLFAVAGGLYAIDRHRSNIERLATGKEPRIGQKLEPSTPG